MKDKRHCCRNGYWFTVQQINNISHLFIYDSNLYPDSDYRSQEEWRRSGVGLCIPINDKEDLKAISKLFK